MPKNTRSRRLLTAVICGATLLLAGSASANIYIYWSGFGGTWQVGVVNQKTSSEGKDTHLSIVCVRGRCRIADDCETCHTAPKRADSFDARVADQHLRTHFPAATVAVGAAPVPFEDAYVQMMSGRMVLLDGTRTPRFRLPPDARLLRDTRTGQTLFVVYPGRSAPEPVSR